MESYLQLSEESDWLVTSFHKFAVIDIGSWSKLPSAEPIRKRNISLGWAGELN